MAEIKHIDLNEWTLVGGGARGDSYFHSTDPLLMLKFDNSGICVDDMIQEAENARIVASLGLPTPEPGEVVTDGKRYGITFHRIIGKESYAKLVGMHPEQIPALAAEFAKVVKQMHGTKGAGTGLRNIKDVYGRLILANPFRSKQQIDRAIALMDSLPDGDTCIHGDLHYGNIIAAHGKSYLIDLGNFCYGYPYFDFGMMLAVDRLSSWNPEFAQQMYHCNPEQTHLFWECFIKAYFGPECKKEDAENSILPYYLVRTMTMEAETGVKLPDQVMASAMEYFDK